VAVSSSDTCPAASIEGRKPKLIGTTVGAIPVRSKMPEAINELAHRTLSTPLAQTKSLRLIFILVIKE
jgi:hypothetical protein